MTEEGIKRPRGRPRKVRTFSDELRERIKARIGWCECCGRPIGSVAQAARDMHVKHTTLYWFLRGVKPLSGPATDRAITWLDRGQP